MLDRLRYWLIEKLALGDAVMLNMTVATEHMAIRSIASTRDIRFIGCHIFDLREADHFFASRVNAVPDVDAILAIELAPGQQFRNRGMIVRPPATVSQEG